MQKSLDIFKAEPKSVYDVLCDTSKMGFYMPAYQRPYSWEEAHINDLFTDCDNVFRNLLESSDAIIFLGSILTVEDNEAKTVFPFNKKQQPSDIRLVIDGQQRLSTLTLILVALNERLRLHLTNLKKLIEKEESEDIKDSLEVLKESIAELITDTSNTVVQTAADHPLYKSFPKIIRSQVDCWGKDERKATYNSPIAELLISYQKHVLECKTLDKFTEFDRSVLNDSSKRVSENLKIIRKFLGYIEQGFNLKGTDQERLTIDDLLNVETLDLCLDLPIDEELKLAAQKHVKVSPIIFVVAFAKFLLHRVCLTYVEVNNESYAFDMFEALNTTGEPLTAIETFVPKVIEHIGKKRDVNSDDADESINVLKSITDRFEKLIATKEKNDKTKALILAFVRAYEGKVKVTHLRDQRKAMLDSYEKTVDISRDDYLNYLATTTDFLFDHWQALEPNTQGLANAEDLDISNLCLRYLVDIKHDIVQPLLVQFIQQDKKYDQLASKSSGFSEVLKAITAFSVLWRAMSGGADGIDGVYKRLHEKGFEVGGVFNKAYRLRGSTLSSDEFNVANLKAFFRQELDCKISSKESPKEASFDQWLDISSKQPLLTKQKSIKLLLLAAFHGVKLEGEDFVRTNDSKSHFLNTTMWKILSKKDRVKKIYSGNVQWNDKSIADPEVFNKIGNVLVDPRNSISVDEAWADIKQSLLLTLNNDSIEHVDKLINEFSGLSEETKLHTSTLLLESKFEEITYCEEWDKRAIEERTHLLLANAWENLYSWLE
ncbi:hypothetical protein CWC16_01160 [Pseudoalteromonas sp. S3776]|uniref:DUF262 domain-containing protein n=1 Tax=Pseudoalteromonas sp. S3776 TaxID=579544 RepID=UPI001109DBB2|nr:DUF262 domain-containing protein [Pseudoalteromonas sp. S3776]TMO82401.1 hypothetical protein CWC16_01160 [Pseudoalteromonas sp. S3776]